MDGFRRPRTARPAPHMAGRQPAQQSRPMQSTPAPREQPLPAPVAPAAQSPVEQPMETVSPPPVRRRKKWPWVLLALMSLIIGVAVGAFWWYQGQLRPVSDDTKKQSFVITDGDSVATIAKKLKDAKLIRSDLAFQIYVRLHGKNKLQAGSCRLAPSQTMAEMLDKMTAGCRDFKAITFYPGGTLEPSRHKASRSKDNIDKSSARYVLKQAGYSDKDIDEAFQATYESPLFAGKPADASLEGYIFGETYHVAADASAKEVLETVFAHMYQVVQRHGLEEKFKQRGLTLYQGIILASIVERELTCEDKPTPERKERCYQYQRGIAQVFLKRHATNMQLGSDITAVYAADHKGIEIPKNDTKTLVEIDSPYNTRKHAGLTPTPIAAPGELALKAVAMPTDTDHLFFLAGDDGLIYFARTDEEHQANIRQHCQVLCKII